MQNMEIKNLAEDLDMRIANHISNGNVIALNNVKSYHMEEVRKIRSYMLSFIDDISNPWLLNQYFHAAVSELNINLQELITPSTTLIIDKKAVRKAM
ncbi:MAG: hypothetical protein ACI4XM_00980 [Candidatus Coprovivens sp.]